MLTIRYLIWNLFWLLYISLSLWLYVSSSRSLMLLLSLLLLLLLLMPFAASCAITSCFQFQFQFQFHLSLLHILNLTNNFTYNALVVICSFVVSTSKTKSYSIKIWGTNSRTKSLHTWNAEIKTVRDLSAFRSDSLTFSSVLLWICALVPVRLIIRFNYTYISKEKRTSFFLIIFCFALLCFNLCFQDDTLAFLLSFSVSLPPSVILCFLLPHSYSLLLSLFCFVLFYE